MANRTLPLSAGIYHIYNRAVGDEYLFREDKHYVSFLNRIEKYLLPNIHLWCYCLMPNHFHLLAEIKEDSTGEGVSKNISDCCNSYTKWFNLVTHRKGSLFMRPFKRDLIKDDAHLAWIIWYIHRNPIHHGFAKELDEWKYSSYKSITFPNTKTASDRVLKFFGGVENFFGFHNTQLKGYFEGLE